MIEPNSLLSPIQSRKDLLDNPSSATGTRKKLMKLEAIRGFAAFYVVCHHTLPKYTVIAGHEIALFRYAQEAVMLFFILSGFVIQYAYSMSADKSFKSFFLKRFLRIYIPILCVFATNYLFAESLGQTALDSGFFNLIGNLLMLQQVTEIWHHPVWFKPFLNNQPLWTLSFEWWFYMIFFFVFSGFGAKASRVVYITGVASALLYLVLPLAVVRELMYLVIWWAGADLARLYINNADITIKNMLIPLLALSAIAAIMMGNLFLYKQNHPGEELFFAASPIIEVRHFGFCAVALVVAIIWRKMNWIGFRYTFGLFEPFAVISFTLYISHWFLVTNAHYLDNYFSNIYFKSLVYFMLCCLFCYVVERMIYPYISKRILQYFLIKKKPLVAVN